MSGVLIDSCVLLDLFTNDPHWANWSESILEECRSHSTLHINPIIYTEISIGFSHIEKLENILLAYELYTLEIPRESLFLAGKTYLRYRQNKGTKHSPLPDFFIGAHAEISNLKLITRDVSKYRTYFPKVKLVCPDSLKTPLRTKN